ncbi:MAG TPA: hypothetical protein VNH15_01280 [Elusimicrobiota bacterium]|nr:hypothetical protein [Elusimicrobiota bacterium]
MKKTAAAAALILALGASLAKSASSDTVKTATKAPAKTEALSIPAETWLTHLKDALTQTTLSGEYQKGDVAQVAAVRGARQQVPSADKPVWKGGFSDQARVELKKERAALAQGVDLLLQGRLAEGRAQILAFEKQYPRSRLRGAAEEALRKTASEAVLQRPAAPKTDAPPASAAPAAKSSR